MDEIKKEMKTTGRGFRMSKQKFEIIYYTDDTVAKSQDEENLSGPLQFSNSHGKIEYYIDTTVVNHIYRTQKMQIGDMLQKRRDGFSNILSFTLRAIET